MLTRKILSIITMSLIMDISIEAVNEDNGNTENVGSALIKTVERYHTLLLHCDAANGANVEVSWLHNNVNLTNQENIRIYQSDNSIEVSNFDEKDTGEYKCITKMNEIQHVGQPINTVIKQYLKVHAVSSNAIKTHSKDVLSKSFTATCVIDSYPKAKANFLKNGEILRPSNHITISKKVFGKSSNRLEVSIKNVTIKDAGTYKCRAENSINTSEVVANKIIVLQKIKSPPNTKVVKVAHNKVCLEWDKNNENIQEYLIKAHTISGATKYYQTKESKFTMDKLQNGSKYIITITAKNDVGKSPEHIITVTTKRMVPPQIVENFQADYEQIGTYNSYKIILKWSSPKDDGMQNEEGDLMYKVTNCKLENGRKKKSCVTFRTPKHSYSINDVVRGDNFIFSVVPFNKGLQYGPSKTIYYKHNPNSEGMSSGTVSFGSTSKEVMVVFLAFILVWNIVTHEKGFLMM